GTQLGGLTTATGRYTIRNLVPGTYEVRAIRIGYDQVTHEVTITADQVTQLDFALGEQALGLDEIVVTGRAGAARRREVGKSVSQVHVAAVAAPAPNLVLLLQAEAPGLTVSAGNGP